MKKPNPKDFYLFEKVNGVKVGHFDDWGYIQALQNYTIMKTLPTKYHKQIG